MHRKWQSLSTAEGAPLPGSCPAVRSPDSAPGRPGDRSTSERPYITNEAAGVRAGGPGKPENVCRIRERAAEA